MSNLTYQRRIAAALLKCGIGRVWTNPMRTSDVEDAVTRSDVRVLINAKVIKKRAIQGISKGRTIKRKKSLKKGRRRGPGSRKGTTFARYPRKRRWIDTIRPIRRELKKMRAEGVIDRKIYRNMYRWSKGGMFKNVKHMEFYMTTNNLANEEDIKKLR